MKQSGEFDEVRCAERSIISPRSDARGCVHTASLTIYDPCFVVSDTHVACAKYNQDDGMRLRSYKVVETREFATEVPMETFTGIEEIVNEAFPWTIELDSGEWCYLEAGSRLPTGDGGRRSYRCGPHPWRIAPGETFFNDPLSFMLLGGDGTIQLYGLTKGDPWTILSPSTDGGADSVVSVRTVGF